MRLPKVGYCTKPTRHKVPTIRVVDKKIDTCIIELNYKFAAGLEINA